MALDKVNLATVEKMWRREVEAASTYKHLANREPDPKRNYILNWNLTAQRQVPGNVTLTVRCGTLVPKTVKLLF